MSSLDHPIVLQSFAMIDREVGTHNLSPEAYAIARRVIHSTADFDFLQLLKVSPGAIEGAIAAIRQGTPIITDVSMVRQGIATKVAQTFQNPIWVAIEQAPREVPSHKTRTEAGMDQCWQKVPHGIYAIGNAPTALLTLCNHSRQAKNAGNPAPALIIGAPVGFVSVLESKAALSETPVPQIRVEGRKGGSAVAAAILNALLLLAWESPEGENFL
ncbi:MULTISPECIES: precorrin-8X methylmutase [unclassified Leptolyngbya]|uniref:precorrin-8X methylmutase n=1 Tax=unclassified Leptolyngbya TaxID=2650499 RepID=UPI001684B589|nr:MULTISPECIES: precorrin-8X methylmutase [unclassified Leptolyngbya]MBD1914172.1 precorrin-8X methylmutase [Leptolyngbya sp. FACHB-8]MBD2157179.1 precorrin-8X methylmutase [Leptolyngbya sp. FACHB-16]